MIHSLDGAHLTTATANFYVAPGAQLIGAVRLGDWASVWFNAVLRADDALIDIGDGSNVQDGSVIHCDHDLPTLVGRNVTIGHRVLLHGCTIGDDSLIGNGAMVLDGARLGRNCLVAAGALITPGKEFADGSVIMGSPGRVVRQAGEKELAMFARGAHSYQQRVRRYLAGLRPLVP